MCFSREFLSSTQQMLPVGGSMQQQAIITHFNEAIIVPASGTASEADDVISEGSPVGAVASVSASVAKESSGANGEEPREGTRRTDAGDEVRDAEVFASSQDTGSKEEESLESLSAAARLPKAQALQGVHQGIPQGSGRQGQPLGTQGAFQPGPQTIQGINFGRIPTSCALCSRERNLCRIISGIFTRSPLPYGYSLVTPVPAGVCNVTITEMKPSKNFFALRRTDGTYVLNGNWDIQAAGQYQAGGTVFTYTPSNDNHGEQLAAPGPLRESVELMLISQSPNPGIKYEYRVPLSDYLGGGTSGLTPSSGALVPNMAGKVGQTPGLGATQGRVLPGQVTQFQGNPNVANPVKPGIITGIGGQPHVPGLLPYGPSNPNIANGGVLPLNPVLTPIGSGGSHGTFNPSGVVPFKPITPQGGVGRTSSGTPQRNPTFVGTQPSGTISGIPGVLSRGQPVNPIGGSVQGSGTLPRPWNPTYTSQDASRTHPLGTSFQFPSGTGGATVPSGSGFPGQRFPTPPRADGTSLETPGVPRTGFPPEFPQNSVPLRPVAVGRPNTSGRRRIPSGDNSRRTQLPGLGDASPTSAETHRRRHQHGTKGRRKSPGKAPGRPQTPFGPGVQLTQPNVVPSSPYAPSAGNITTTSNRGSKNGRRRQKEEGSEGRKRKGRKRSRFQWAEKGFTPCSKDCGGGNQTTILSCERRRKNTVVADRHCAHLPRPETHTIMCNLKPCPAQWMPGEWGPCSVTCGVGVQTRPLLCKQQVSPTFIMMVPEGACLSPPTVSTSQVCEMGRCPSENPEWEAGTWSNCSAPCGLGNRYRQVRCVASGVRVQDTDCEAISRPHAEEMCDMGSCATSTWFFSEWSEQCSEVCGTGVQTRKVHCLSATDISEGTCPAEVRPASTRPCRGESGCGGQWFTGPWGGCSEACGGGHETRSVVCVTLTKGQWKVAKDNRCPVQERPHSSRECNVQPCMPEWYTSEWSECSASCEGGIMRREVTCLDGRRRPTSECQNGTKPASRQPCHLHPCDALTTSTSRPHDSASSPSTSLIAPRPPQSEDSGDATTPNPYEEYPATTETNGDEDEYYEEGIGEGREEDEDEEEEEEENYDDEDEGDVENELVVVEETGSATNVIPDKDAQGDESVSGDEDEENVEEEEKEKKKRKRKKDKKKGRHNKDEEDEGERQETPPQTQPAAVTPSVSCIDRIKNCHLVFRARLCRLKYYNKLCCRTCSASR